MLNSTTSILKFQQANRILEKIPIMYLPQEQLSLYSLKEHKFQLPTVSTSVCLQSLRAVTLFKVAKGPELLEMASLEAVEIISLV